MRRRMLYTIIISLVLLVLFFSIVFVITPFFMKEQLFGKYIRKIVTDEKVMALTFDDGPNQPYTNQILSLLEKYDAKATFFVLGKHIEENIDIIKKIYNAENEIGNHSWDHKKLYLRTPKYIINQINRTDEAIRKTGYSGEIYFRSPYGSRFIFLPYILMQNKRTHILWNITLGHWESPDPNIILKRLDDQIVPGSIILLHDGYPDVYEERANTVKAVDLILKKYTGEGYRFITITELLKLGQTKSWIVF